MSALELGMNVLHRPIVRNTAGATAILGAVYGYGVYDGFTDRLEVTESSRLGEGTITDAWTMPAKACHGGYEVDVRGAHARLNVQMDLGFMSQEVFDAHMTYKGSMTAEVCHVDDPEKTQAQLLISQKDGEPVITATIAADAFMTTVYPTNPADPGSYVWGGNVVAMAGDSLANAIKALPGNLDMKSADELRSKLQGVAYLAGTRTVAEACGSQAWDLLDEDYAKEVAKGIMADYNIDRAVPVKLENITVDVPAPGKIRFTTQYADQLNEQAAQLTAANITYGTDNAADMKCKASPDIQVGAR
ncbi:MAG TPA: hypothetical protein VK978_05370 [Candidatus Saccharimonadales bacterium]|nr:hypothetical protein [Candidatus Saccharimonadales bacterium]